MKNFENPTEFWQEHNINDSCPGNTAAKRELSRIPILGNFVALEQSPKPLSKRDYEWVGQQILDSISLEGEKQPAMQLVEGEELVLNDYPPGTVFQFTHSTSYDSEKIFQDEYLGLLSQRLSNNQPLMVGLRRVGLLINGKGRFIDSHIINSDRTIGKVSHHKFGTRQTLNKYTDVSIIKVGMPEKKTLQSPTPYLLGPSSQRALQF